MSVSIAPGLLAFSHYDLRPPSSIARSATCLLASGAWRISWAVQKSHVVARQDIVR